MPATAIAATLSGSMSGNAISGFLPPSSSVTCLMPLSAAARWIARPVGTEPVKATRLTFGCRAMASPVGRPVPVTMLTTPAGKHLAADFAEHRGRQRARLRRLEHHAIAGHQRRGQRVGGELDRMVERDDAPDRAVGLADGEMQVLGRGRDGLAFDLGVQPGIVVERVAGGGDVGAHLRDRVAGVDHLDAQDLVGALAQLCRELLHQGGARLRLHRRPGRMRGLRRLNRAIDVGGRALRHVAELLFIGGIDRFQPLAGLARRQFAADQHHSAHEIGLVDGHGTILSQRLLGGRRPIRSAESWRPRSPSATWRPRPSRRR